MKTKTRMGKGEKRRHKKGEERAREAVGRWKRRERKMKRRGGKREREGSGMSTVDLGGPIRRRIVEVVIDAFNVTSISRSDVKRRSRIIVPLS